MKYLIVLCDGMADEPLEELGFRTPLEAAETTCMDRLAAVSEVGLVQTVPKDMAPGSDTANLSVLGYDPAIYYSGRSPLEALSIGVDMASEDVSFRCNLVTLSEEEADYRKKRILDHSAGEISTQEAAVLLEELKKALQRDGYQFYAGTSYRHLLIQKNGSVIELTAPHDILTRRIGDYLPEQPVLREMMERSYEILRDHPINRKRREKGMNPANSIWFWGAGTRPALTSFEKKTGKKGAMISAVDLLKGIAVGASMDVLHVDGATGGLDTNYKGKGETACKALAEDGYDFVYVHIEAPDEMGHQGNAKHKMEAIHRIDEQVIGPVTKKLQEAGVDFRMLILPDHPTPVKIRTHTGDAVPYMLYDSTAETAGVDTYDEATGRETGIFCEDGHMLIDHLLQIGRMPCWL